VADGLQTDPNLSHFESFLALDLGGGSLELIETTNGETKQAISLPLGAVAIASQSNISLKSPLPQELLFELRTYIEAQLHLQASKFSQSPHPLIGCGGTLVFLRLLLGDSNGKDSSKICLSDLELIMQKMFSLSLEDRIAGFPRLPADRADVFPFGLLTVACAMKYLGYKRLTHSFHNLRHGLIFQQA
jgi:exopolyphosphatase/pppGpp-phosphohydrolase